ncbi:rCG44407 [Rattus norvegicus]|uniref:RCG44407 n=1 Tax=Rattus norvegicus TaxID=10116 RepID=A6I5R4_RAT|nr:rCG44407 [Rattus norvegicus]
MVAGACRLGKKPSNLSFLSNQQKGLLWPQAWKDQRHHSSDRVFHAGGSPQISVAPHQRSFSL